jgi:ApaG protein
VWAYTVRIENQGDAAVQLRSRHWKITDGLGRLQEVKGPGVVGKTPLLRPGEMFEYTSGTPLSTPSGFMSGTYQMVAESGEKFDIEIPTFSLDTPGSKRQLN